MPARPITPRLAERLCWLTASQLQIQAARSVALDASALGVMGLDAAVAAILAATKGVYGLGILALLLLGLSLGVAVRTLLHPGARKNGPSATEMLEARARSNDTAIEENLLNDLANDVQINEQALARKDHLITRALELLVLAIAVELAGRL